MVNMVKMSKISYIVLPKHEERRFGDVSGLSGRVIGNATRLLVALVLMGALVAIIFLAAHTAVQTQPVQPWTLAPLPVLHDEPKPERQLILRQYILCESELLPVTKDGGPVISSLSKEGRFDTCAVLRLHLEVDKLDRPDALCSPHWNSSHQCREMKYLPESESTEASLLIEGENSPKMPVFNFNEEQMFNGTPFLNNWQHLLDAEGGLLDACVRLLLVWRYGGVACNLDDFDDMSSLDSIRLRNIMNGKSKDVLIEKTNASVIYSARPCHSAIGYMLTFFAEPPSDHKLTNYRYLLKIMTHNVQQLYQDSVYFIRNFAKGVQRKRKVSLIDHQVMYR